MTENPGRIILSVTLLFDTFFIYVPTLIIHENVSNVIVNWFLKKVPAKFFPAEKKPITVPVPFGCKNKDGAKSNGKVANCRCTGKFERQ